jgi:hypothetical protein
MAKWAKTQSYLPKFLLSLPDLKCPNGDLAITREVKAYALRNYIFPDPEAIGHTDIRFFIYPFSLDLLKVIQADEIQEIMRK